VNDEMGITQKEVRALLRRMKDLERRMETLSHVASSAAHGGASAGTVWWLRWMARGTRTRAERTAARAEAAMELLAPGTHDRVVIGKVRDRARALQEALEAALEELEGLERAQRFHVVQGEDAAMLAEDE
jgi:hypothetical protein